MTDDATFLSWFTHPSTIRDVQEDWIKMTVMVDEERITKEFYNKLTPFQQGYATYFQAEWPDSEIPKTCPYPEGSNEAKQFASGSNAAMIAAMDAEE